jgi:hypothetical protein
MTYTILSATYANADLTAAVLETVEAGAVVASVADTPELWEQMLSAGIDIATPAAPDFRAPIWADFKARREIYLNRLTGIGGRAERNGLAAIADAADDFSQGLLDLPSHASVQPAVTPTAESLTDAILALYRALAATARATPGATTEFDKVSA